VASTGQIGLVLVRRRNKVRQDWRIEFACGSRAERFARADFRQLRDLSQMLNCAPDDVLTAAKRLTAERDAHFVALRAALQQLAATEAAVVLQTHSNQGERPHLVERIIADSPAEYLGLFAAALVKHENVIALLAGAESGDVVFAQHPGAGRDMAVLLKRVFAEVGGKGGGGRDFARGKILDLAGVSRAIELARTLLLS
jgi:alanyl-tRNA synthetase